jgi:hypothetical protein
VSDAHGVWAGPRISAAWAAASTLLGDHGWHDRRAVHAAMVASGVTEATARRVLCDAVGDGLLLTQRSAGGGRIRGYRLPSLAERAQTYRAWLTRPNGEEPLAPRDVLHVRLSVRHVSYLIEHALNSLGGPPHVRSAVRRSFGVDVATDDTAVVVAEELEPCCSNCCAPCAAVTELDADGRLSIVLSGRGPGYIWWDADRGEVDRAWLAARIRSYCENGLTGDLNRCTDYGTDYERCGQLGRRICRERPEHEACRAERVCILDTDHDGKHSWEAL